MSSTRNPIIKQGKNQYRHKPIKTTVYGHHKIGLPKDAHTYDSLLEARMARLLIQYQVPFTPHVLYHVVTPDGKPFTYTIDFILESGHHFAGIPGIINAIEVKGVLSKKDIRRIDALDYCHRLRSWIVTETHIKMWEHEGLYW